MCKFGTDGNLQELGNYLTNISDIFSHENVVIKGDDDDNKKQDIRFSFAIGFLFPYLLTHFFLFSLIIFARKTWLHLKTN